MSGRLVAEMNSPHTLRRGKGVFSTNATDQPRCASNLAAVDPAGPAPITIASCVMARFCVLAPRKEAMREGKSRAFLQTPTGRVRPQLGEFVPAKAGAHAD